MKIHVIVLACLATHAFCVRADNPLVNERPAASAVERERHWALDCRAVRDELFAWLEDENGGCGPGELERRAALGEKLRLCAAIHNVPGEAASCPDHGAAAREIETMTLTDCPVPADRQVATRTHFQCPD